MKLEFSEYTGAKGLIQKIELSTAGDVSVRYCRDLYSLVSALCLKQGLIPDVDERGFMTQLKSFISNVQQNIICILIDANGLFLKDKLSAEKYISTNFSGDISNEDPILLVI